MWNRARARFLRGLFYVAVPPILDYLGVVVMSEPIFDIFGEYAPVVRGVVSALLLGLDKLVRDWKERG